MVQYTDDEIDEIAENYGTPNSVMLKKIHEAGFKPIAITVLICEETFIFKDKAQAMAAWEIFKPEGWWYDFASWEDTRQEYVKNMYGGNEEDAPTVYWLDKNFAPKEQ